MSSCSIRWCGKNSRTSNIKTDGVTFHRFPKEPDIREKWIDSTKRNNWFPSYFSVICSQHFTEDCIDVVKARRCLFGNAIPTLNLPVTNNVKVTSEDASEHATIQKDPETLQNSSPTKERLAQRIKALSSKVKHKNKKIKLLRSTLQHYKKRVETLKVNIEELENE